MPCWQAAGQRGPCGTRPAGRTRGSGPGADEIVREPGLWMLAAALGLGDGHSRDPSHHGWHSGGCRRAGPGRRRSCRAESFLLGRIRQGPPCMRWGALPGLATPDPASCLALPAPRTARRCQAPVQGTGLPAPPTLPGRPGVVPVSNGESISTASANTAQEPEVNYFRVLTLSTRYPQKAGSYPRLAVVIHRSIHSPSTSYLV